MLMALHASLNHIDNDKGDKEKRTFFQTAILKAIEEYRPDKKGWEAMKQVMEYDDYLVGRQVDGTVTPYDLVRPGLLRNQFASEYSYYEHLARITKTDPRDLSAKKTCSACGDTKSATHFRHRGGAVCHSCRGKAYRKNKADGV